MHVFESLFQFFVQRLLALSVATAIQSFHFDNLEYFIYKFKPEAGDLYVR